jgi:Na+-driven multidrug efflux pump
MRRLIGWGVASGVVFGGVLAGVAPWLGYVFSSDAGVIAAVPVGTWVVAGTMPLGALVFVLDGVLIGAGDGRYLALAGVVNLAVYVPLLWWITEILAAPEAPVEVGAPAAVLAIQLAYCVGFYGIRALTLGVRAFGTRWIGSPAPGTVAQLEP